MSFFRRLASRENLLVLLLCLIVVAVLIWGSGRLFRPMAPFVCYFEGSVTGEIAEEVSLRVQASPK